MRIGCLQFAPKLGDVNNNLNRADAVLSKANPENLDLLCLPELSFTGYNFKSLQDISPFLEPQGSGVTALWARTVALKYNCVTIVGYPEICDVKAKWPTGPEYYNSAIIVSGEGETIGNYRKNFLYYTDETWALEGGEGFWQGSIPGLGNTSLGICMDINPYKFEAPFHAFEFAFHVLEMGSNLVVLSMAWLTREDGRMFSRMPNEPDLDTLTYWVTRLEPLIRAESEEEIIIVFANRCGIEDDAVYAGTSTVIGIKDGEVNVYGILGRGEKELLIVDTDAAPYAKLVYRPDDNASGGASADDDRTKDGSNNTSARPDKEDPSKRSEQPKLQGGSDSTGASTTQTPKHTDSYNMSRKATQPISPLSESTLANYESISPSSATKDYDYVPLGRGSRAGSDRSTKSMQGSIVSGHSGTSRKSKGSSRTRASKESLDSKSLTSRRSSSKKAKTSSPRIQIPPLKSVNDSIPTPTAPSPTPLAVRPKLTIPKDAHKRPHIPTPHPNPGQKGQVSMEQQNTILTPTTAFDDLSPQFPTRSFWASSDSHLRNSKELRNQSPILEHSSKSPKSIVEDVSISVGLGIEGKKSKPTSKDVINPSPVKPRVSSQSRRRGRADSVFDQRPSSTGIAQRLDTMSPRPDSSVGKKVDTSSPYPYRPSSLKSRNTSRNRPANPVLEDDPLEQQYFDFAGASIPISASPSIHDSSAVRGSSAVFRPENRMSNVESTYRQTSHTSRTSRSRSNSYKAPNPSVQGVVGNSWQPRAISRGRQRAPKELTGATNNTDISGRSGSPKWSVQGDVDSEDDDEIVEEIIVRRSPSCAIHGDRHHQVGTPGQESNVYTKIANVERRDSSRVIPEPERLSNIQSATGTSNKSPESELEAQPNFYASSTEDLTDAERLLATHWFLFDPKTPKAMVFETEGNNVAPNAPRSAPFVQPLKIAKHIGQEALSNVRPKSAVW
ncbi:carbon-nitrogen hydrolase [Daldinia caldariorum]|uniref:carbon-nitrogen hydrolase n=1 Tax=Daldinia caldariorum TaxID=326644 RepID=UPI002007ED73|nr:carbon-nitrogen hydrolase [Daldinia caldariorum]KAI1468558.1 carbon-nitrogen hydrolase [Daldinia caldariorum]